MASREAEMAEHVEALLEAYRRGPDALVGYVEAHRTEFTPELTERLRTEADQALQGGDAGAAHARLMVLANVHAVLGQSRESLIAYRDVTSVEYMAAQTEADYAGVRATISGLLPMTQQIGAADLAFQLAVTAADCAYFASAVDGADTEKWLVTAGDEVAGLADFAAGQPRDLWFEKYASLLVAIAHTLMPRVGMGDRAANEAVLRRLSCAADDLIPVDYEFDDPTKSDYAARTLAELAAFYACE